jgi:high-affinity Fe2+/Pb2+ permease
MKVSRLKFVIRFLVFGFAYTSATRLILNQMPASLSRSNYGSVSQASWQIAVSTMLTPVKFVLMGPLLPLFNWMLSQQDADPPPPMLLVMYAFYWVILALVLHYFLSKLKHPQTAGRPAGKSTST